MVLQQRPPYREHPVFIVALVIVSLRLRWPTIASRPPKTCGWTATSAAFPTPLPAFLSPHCVAGDRHQSPAGTVFARKRDRRRGGSVVLPASVPVDIQITHERHRLLGDTGFAQSASILVPVGSSRVPLGYNAKHRAGVVIDIRGVLRPKSATFRPPFHTFHGLPCGGEPNDAGRREAWRIVPGPRRTIQDFAPTPWRAVDPRAGRPAAGAASTPVVFVRGRGAVHRWAIRWSSVFPAADGAAAHKRDAGLF